ncbi:crossover junction endodeoxyribonuclease RuvC [Mangrovibacterium lignilyticum]|uniref:crossover junction endodeoxyribonuclease RuvC n=1 Tax=Mangrovibacterium lignilyticum TaxID=2668052 RepID=UPI0013D5FCBB|nr:crossover junction endodeoxyribonuclease RuvC [Mangrovibacterium lignilyticum]
MSLEGKRILGIDPGTIVMGYGLIEVKDNTPRILQVGVVKTAGYDNHYLRLKHIFKRTQALIDEYMPDELAIESPFYGKDIQAMLKLGRAQGIIMGIALSRDIPVFEYAPLKIKQSITGMGRAAKEQVAYFLKNTMKIENLPPELDATDAIAVAVCHYLQMKNPVAKAGYKNWGEFIKKNPGRVK